MTKPLARDQVASAARAVLEDVPGVDLGPVVVDMLQGMKWRITVKAVAWSPGLYGMPVTWIAEIGRHSVASIPFLRGMRTRRLVDMVRHAFDEHVTLQFARANRALLLGITSPLELPTAARAASTPGSMRIDHLLVDRMALVRLVGAISASQGTAGALRAPLDRQLAFDAASAHELDLQGPTVFAGDIVKEDGRLVRSVNVIRKLPVMMREVSAEHGQESLLQAHFAFGGLDAPLATFDGSHLILMTPLPEIVLSACIGRWLGDVVATGTRIDDREIVSARIVGTATVLGTHVDAVRVSDLPREIVMPADVEAMEAVPLL